MNKFAILNPATGAYDFVNTEQERDAQLVKTAWEFYLLHTHGQPYSVVVTQEDGSEQWFAPESVTAPELIAGLM